MRLKEAIEIAKSPPHYQDRLRLALLKLEVATLRAFPSSPRQHELAALCRNIRAMPEHLWRYP